MRNWALYSNQRQQCRRKTCIGGDNDNDKEDHNDNDDDNVGNNNDATFRIQLNEEAAMQLPRMIVLEAAIEAMTKVAMSHDIQPTSSEKVKSTNFQYVNRPFYSFLLSCLAFE